MIEILFSKADEVEVFGYALLSKRALTKDEAHGMLDHLMFEKRGVEVLKEDTVNWFERYLG